MDQSTLIAGVVEEVLKQLARSGAGSSASVVAPVGAGAHGVFNMSAQDHVGLDQRSRVMVKIENGSWKLSR